MPKLDHEMFRDYSGGNFMAIRFFSDPVRVLSIGLNPILVLLIRSDPVRVLSIRSDPIRSRFCKRPFVSAHVRAFSTLEPVSKSTYPSRFYYNYSLPASKLGLISNFSHFPSLQVVESVTRSSSKSVGFALET